MSGGTYRERPLADDKQGAADNGNALGNGLEVSRLFAQLADAIGDLRRREGGQDGRRNERGTNDEGAEGNHLGGCWKFVRDT